MVIVEENAEDAEDDDRENGDDGAGDAVGAVSFRDPGAEGANSRKGAGGRTIAMLAWHSRRASWLRFTGGIALWFGVNEKAMRSDRASMNRAGISWRRR